MSGKAFSKPTIAFPQGLRCIQCTGIIARREPNTSSHAAPNRGYSGEPGMHNPGTGTMDSGLAAIAAPRNDRKKPALQRSGERSADSAPNCSRYARRLGERSEIRDLRAGVKIVSGYRSALAGLSARPNKSKRRSAVFPIDGKIGIERQHIVPIVDFGAIICLENQQLWVVCASPWNRLNSGATSRG